LEVVEKWDATITILLNYNIFDLAIYFSPTLAKGLESIEAFVTIIGPFSSRELKLGVDV
jgi:hypothetical protein